MKALNLIKSIFSTKLKFIKKYPKKGKINLIIFFILGYTINILIQKTGHQINLNRQLASLESQIETEEKSIPITIKKIEKKTLLDVFSLNGNLIPLKEIYVTSDNKVTVEEINVRWGEKVKKGQQLFKVNSRAHQIQMELNKIEDSLKTSDFNVMAKLMKKEIISQVEFKQKELELKSQNLRRELEKVESGSGILNSPIAGTVAEIKMKVGDYIDQSGKYFIKIVDGSELKFESFLPLDIATRLKEGDLVNINYENKSLIGDGKKNEETEFGKIEGISPIVDSSSGTVLVTVALSKFNPNWRPGIYVKTTFTLNKREEALSIKNESILYEKGKPFTYKIIKEEGKDRAEKVNLDLGISDGLYTEVINGLKEDDLIADQGIGTLSENSQVEIFNY